MMARTTIVNPRTLLRLAVLLSNLVTVCHAAECSIEEWDSEHYFNCAYYYKQLEEGLLRDENEVFWLFRSFFRPEEGHPPVTLTVSVRVTVGKIPQQPCIHADPHPAFHFDGSSWVGHWSFSLSSSGILKFISYETIYAFDNTITWAVHALATGLGGTETSVSSIGIHVHQLACIPSREVMTEVLTLLLTQAKAYARAKGKPSTWDKKDSMYVTAAYAQDENGEHRLVLQTSREGNGLVFAIYLLLNILVTFYLVIQPIFFFKYKIKVDHKGNEQMKRMRCYHYIMKRVSEKNRYYCIYWATMFVVFSINVINCGVFIIATLHGHPNIEACFDRGSPCDREFVRPIFITRCTIVFFLIVIDLLVAFYVCFFLCKCCSCKCCKMCMTQAVEIIALTSFMLFVQTIAMAFIPICILLFMYPAQVISALAFIVSAMLCVIIIIAHILHLDNRQQSKAEHCLSFLQICTVLTFLALLGIIITFYLLLLNRGVSASGITGFLLSLLPSATLSAIAWLINKKLLKTEDPKINAIPTSENMQQT